MTVVRERFRDSAGTLPDYIFEVNHSDEEGQEHTLNLERTAVTTGVNFVRQQGSPSPRILNYTGTILTQNQYDKMLAYYAACETRTIFFRDVDNIEYEVVITAFTPTRQRVVRNSRQPDVPWKWTYRLQMEVIA